MAESGSGRVEGATYACGVQHMPRSHLTVRGRQQLQNNARNKGNKTQGWCSPGVSSVTSGVEQSCLTAPNVMFRLKMLNLCCGGAESDALEIVKSCGATVKALPCCEQVYRRKAVGSGHKSRNPTTNLTPKPRRRKNTQRPSSKDATPSVTSKPRIRNNAKKAFRTHSAEARAELQLELIRDKWPHHFIFQVRLGDFTQPCPIGHAAHEIHCWVEKVGAHRHRQAHSSVKVRDGRALESSQVAIGQDFVKLLLVFPAPGVQARHPGLELHQFHPLVRPREVVFENARDWSCPLWVQERPNPVCERGLYAWTPVVGLSGELVSITESSVIELEDKMLGERRLSRRYAHTAASYTSRSVP
ncbi:hypothetical protein FB451DRAFT_1180166 [Mycena latifolia]|nr:hypothetical protein FB451DRAFT_1180166 [Mycena latifolia]